MSKRTCNITNKLFEKEFNQVDEICHRSGVTCEQNLQLNKQVGNYSSNIIKESSSMGAPMSVLVTNKQVMNFEPL